jgi:lactonase family protein with 7-bladed beta-propeller
MSVAYMGRRSGHITLLACFVVLALTLGSAPWAHAQLNLVYVEGNVVGGSGNQVIGFSNDGAGNLTPLPGSPYFTGGFGVTGVFSDVQFDSDGELLANTAGSLLLAVNGGSNSISAFDVNADGSLTLAAGSPLDSGGQDPVSLAMKEHSYSNGDSLMVVTNKASDPLQTGTPNYTTFEVTSSGAMTLNAGSAFALPAGTSPVQIITRPGTRVQFFGIEFMDDEVATYKVSKAGILSQISTANAGSFVVGGVAHPLKTGIYIGLPGVNQVGVTKYDSAGNLTILRKVSNPGQLVCWLTMNAAGTHLYTGETPSGSVTFYDTTNAGNPIQKQHFVLSPAGSLAAHVKLDPTEKFLYVVDRLGYLHVLDVDSSGMLSENRAPTDLGLIPLGGIPQGLVTMLK